MKEILAGKKQLTAMLLVIVFVLSMAASLLIVPAAAADNGIDTSYKPSHDVPRRDIAIVFDNSGSMYQDGNNAWCRAIYSMQVFAAMLNSGDRLAIYPMNEIETAGNTYSMDEPLLIYGNAVNTEQIRDIYTSDCVGTPIESIDRAYEGLSDSMSDYDEHWLVVLTDGDVFNEDGDAAAADAEEAGTTIFQTDTTKDTYYFWDTTSVLTNRLSEYNDEDVRVLYLGIGKDAVKPVIDGEQDGCVFTAEDSSEICSKLIEIGNTIFVRDEFPASLRNGSTLNIDIPLSKLIVYALGENADDTQLTGVENVLSAPENYAVQYGEHAETNLSGYCGSIDTALKGKVLIYENVQPGTYTLSNEDAVVYYEPNVQVHVRVTGTDQTTGETGVLASELEERGELKPGNYTVSYWIENKSTGEPVYSPLLGDVIYNISCDVNGETVATSNPDQAVTDPDGDSLVIPLDKYDKLTVSGDITYLSDYKVDVYDVLEGMPADGLELASIEETGGSKTYDLSTLYKDENAKYYYELSYADSEGNIHTLSDEELNQIIAQGGVNLQAIQTETGKALNIESSAEDGKLCCRLNYTDNLADETDLGNYKLSGDITYLQDDHEKKFTVTTEEFEIVYNQRDIALTLSPGNQNYTRSKLTTSDPLVLSVSESINGSPVDIDDEELAYLNSVITTENLKDSLTVEDQEGNLVSWENLSVKNVPGTSDYNISFTDQEGVDLGKYKVTYQQDFVREGPVSYGKTVSAETEPSYVTIRRIPRWLSLLLILLAILLLLAIAYLISNMKVLPKLILCAKAGMIIKAAGVKVATVPKPRMDGAGRKKGSIKITSTAPPKAPMAKTYLQMDLEAVSPRRTPSAKRRAMVVGGRAPAGSTVTIDGTPLKADKRGNLMQADGTPLEHVRISNHSSCSVSSTINDIRGPVHVSMTVSLEFK